MLDNSLLFEPVAGTAITVSATSTNVLDMLKLRDVGVGNALELHVQVLTNFTAAGAGTLQISFQASPDNANWYDLVFSPIIAKANLIVGAPIFRYIWPVNQMNESAETNVLPNGSPGRYYRLNYVVATGPFTAGAITAYVTGDKDRGVYFSYPRNYNIAA